LLGKFLQFNNEKQSIYLAQDKCQLGAERPMNGATRTSIFTEA